MTENDTDTHHLVIEDIHGTFYIISSELGQRNNSHHVVRLIEVDPKAGSLQHCGIAGLDVFHHIYQAVDYLISSRQVHIVNKTFVHAILGIVTFVGGVSYILGSTKARQDATLPGGHNVHALIEWQWLRVSGIGVPINSKDAATLDTMMKYPFYGTHYYCLTYDLTHPFPGPPAYAPSSSESSTNVEFCWNSWMRAPFEAIGVGSHCAILLQGMAISIPFFGNTSTRAHLYMLLRRSCLNPGTRFHTTGMNEFSEPGNETEMELIMWREDQSALAGEPTRIAWTSYVWRRGMVPLWWRIMPKANSPKTGSEGEMIVRDRPYEGCAAYYSRVLHLYGASAQFVHIHLLRAFPHDAQEAALTEFLEESLSHVAMAVPFHVTIVHYDWLTNLKLVGSDRAIEGLWARSKDSLHKIGFSYGVQVGPVLNALSRQRGMARFTCADSLERTHTATFFMMLPVVAEMCRHLGLSSSGRILTDIPGQPQDGAPRNGGKTDTGPNPQVSQPWSFFDRTLDVVSKSLKKIGVLEGLTSCFIYSGDVASILFTNGPAMHTGLMREYAANVSSPLSLPQSLAATSPINTPLVATPPQTSLLASQRSYQAVNSEVDRNFQYNIFLGRETQGTCARALCGAQIARTTATGSMEIFIVLERPAIVQDLSISLIPLSGVPSPWIRMDVAIGAYSDKSHIVLQGITVPCGGSGLPQLLYSLPLSAWTAFELSQTSAGHSGRIIRVALTPIPSEVPQIKLFGSWVGEKHKPKLQPLEISLYTSRQNLMYATQTVVDFIVKELEMDKKPDNTSPKMKNKTDSPKPILDPSAAPVAKYRELVQAQSMPLRYTAALALEWGRIQMGLSAEQRDNVVASILTENTHNLALDNFNPDYFVVPRDEKTESQIRRTARAKQKASPNPNSCASPSCSNSLGLIRQRQCAYCKNRFCSDCMAPEPWKIIEYCWDNNPHSVCKTCSSEISNQTQLTRLIEAAKDTSHNNSDNAKETWNTLLDSMCANSLVSVRHKKQVYGEYPNAAIFSNVLTADSSPPIESIIFPVGSVPLTTYWCAPSGVEAVSIPIILEGVICVESISLLVDAAGYTHLDAPLIEISVGVVNPKKLTHNCYDTKMAGRWEVGACDPRSYFRFVLETPSLCSMIELSCKLPHTSTSNANRVLHLGRVQVHGTAAALQTPFPHSPGINKAPRGISVQYRQNKRILEMAIDKNSPQPTGFSLEVGHGDSGAANQVKLLRVTAATTNQKAEVTSFHLISRYIVPKAASNTILYFGFPTPLPLVNIITFEYLSSYGGESFDIASCIVNLVV